MATTPQGISRVLKNAGFQISHDYKGRITYHHSEGFQVRRDWRKEVVINYVFRTHGFSRVDSVTKKMEVEKSAVAFLESRGYSVEKGEFGWNIRKES